MPEYHPAQIRPIQVYPLEVGAMESGPDKLRARKVSVVLNPPLIDHIGAIGLGSQHAGDIP